MLSKGTQIKPIFDRVDTIQPKVMGWLAIADGFVFAKAPTVEELVDKLLQPPDEDVVRRIFEMFVCPAFLVTLVYDEIVIDPNIWRYCRFNSKILGTHY